MIRRERIPGLEEALKSLRNTASGAAPIISNSIVIDEIRRLEERLKEMAFAKRRDIPRPDFINGGRVRQEPSVLPPLHRPSQEDSTTRTLPGRNITSPDLNNLGLSKPPTIFGRGLGPDKEDEV